MPDIRGKVQELYALEQLAAGDSCIHRLHPAVKLLAVAVYVLCIVSFDRYALTRLVPFLLYPVIVMAIAGIPYHMIGTRICIALPFCLFAGLSNLWLDRTVLVYLGNVPVTAGLVSLLTILLRTCLCVTAVLLLVAVTPFSALIGQLRRFHVPAVFLLLFEITYRYVGVLLEEAAGMYTAYHLRSLKTTGVNMKHMGSFVGQLLLRSFDRADRIYQAMKCRGYGGQGAQAARRPLHKADILYLGLVCAGCVGLRLFHWF